jgi:predicted aspartyl protease
MASKHIPFRLLNINGDGYHLQIKVKVNGKLANFLIDTGASKTVFDQDQVQKFLRKEMIQNNDMLSTGLGTNSMKSQIVHLTKFQVGDYIQHDYTFVLLDLSYVNQTYEAIGIKPIDGVIGSDWLESVNAVIDFGKKRLTIHNPVSIKKNTKPVRKSRVKSKAAVARKKKTSRL